MLPIQQRVKLYKISHGHHSQDIFPFAHISKNVNTSLTILIWGAWHQMYISLGKKKSKMQAPSKKENKFKVCYTGSCLWALCKREEEILQCDFTPMTIQLENQSKEWAWVLQGWDMDDTWDSCSGLISCLFGFATQQQTKKSPRQDLKSYVQSWNEIQTAKQHCIWLWESFPGEKAFWLELFFPVISLWLFSLPNSGPSHPSPASPALPERRVQLRHAVLPFGHSESRQEGMLFPHRAHSTYCQHSLTVKRDLHLIWAARSQAKQRIWLQSSSLSEQDSWNGIQLTSAGLICSYRVNRVQGMLLKYFKYTFPWMLQKWLYNCSPSGK